MFLLPCFSATTWTLLLLAVTLSLLYGIWPYNFFRKLGVSGPRPWPFLGTLPYTFKGFTGFIDYCRKNYGDVFGLYEGRTPYLIVADLDMVKTILVKECYSVFTNRREFALELGPFADGITVAKDEKWKRIRSTLSPAFTSGRLRQVFPIVERHADRLIGRIKKMDLDKPIEAKQLMAPYSLDCITSATFSVDTDSTNHPDDPLVVHLKKVLNMNFFLLFFLMVFPFAADLLKRLKFTLMPQGSVDFFFNLIRRFKSQHHEEQASHSDFLQLMIQNEMSEETIKNEQPSKGLTENEILSQAFTYIFGGYETTSVTLSFILYNLAINPDAMQTLQQEIDHHIPKDAPISHKALGTLDYLDQVIAESMRLLPTAPQLERVCKKNVQVKGLTIPAGTLVGIPLYALQRDPRYWTSPELFRPERFSKDSGEEINTYAYMPFGLGPRNCVGMRFALMVMKLVLVRLLQDYDVETCKDTVIPLEFNALFQPKTPIKLKFALRETANIHQ